jgi:hypothetical protein
METKYKLRPEMNQFFTEELRNSTEFFEWWIERIPSLRDFEGILEEVLIEKEMTKEEIKKWLEDTVHDLLMDFFFYDRKNDKEIDVHKLEQLMLDGTISKKLLIEVFTKQIEEEYE